MNLLSDEEICIQITICILSPILFETKMILEFCASFTYQHDFCLSRIDYLLTNPEDLMNKFLIKKLFLLFCIYIVA